MEEELSADIIKTTQLSLGKFVKRPPLTEKLLKKPPFRFLHDVIITVLKTTGFFEGLFEQDELISDNVKDRESKIQFLSKIITVLGIATGKTLTVKPSKIVAGQEPAKTNELLQCLGEALEKQLSSAEAVQKYKENIKTLDANDKNSKNCTKVVKKNQDVKKAPSIRSNKSDSPDKDQKTVPKLRIKETVVKETLPKKQTITNVKKSVVKNIQDSKTNIKKVKQEKSPNLKQNDDTAKITEKVSGENISELIDKKDSTDDYTNNHKELQKEHFDTGKEETSIDITNEMIPEKSETELKLVKSDSQDDKNNFDNSIQHRKSIVEETNSKIDSTKEVISNSSDTHKSSYESNSVNNTDKRPQSVRPSSSRPGAPRVKEKHDSTSIGTEQPIAHKPNIIVENTVPEEEEDGSIIIVENQTNSTLKNNEQLQLNSKQHGHLVQQILDSQKEFSQISGKTEIEWHFGAQKARDVANQEIEQMRFSVQALSRISNPLGKLIDHIQEDVEVMRQELHEWTKKYEEASIELTKQKIINVESLQPLQAKIKQLDADIEEKKDKINDLRIVVFKNYYRIENLLSANGSVQ